MTRGASESSYSFVRNSQRLVHVVDWDLGFCQAISAALKIEGFEVMQFAEMSACFDKMKLRHPHVVVLNACFERQNSMPLLSMVREVAIDADIILIEDNVDLSKATAAMKLGASDVLAKPIDVERLIRLIKEGMQTDAVVGHLPIAIKGFRSLSARQRQTLQLVVSGYSSREIGDQMEISPRTVELHRSIIMKKLGVRNTAELVRLVVASGGPSALRAASGRQPAEQTEPGLPH